MGGTDKCSNIKGQSGKNKECVSEATISKLLDDFNCASLLTCAKTPEAKDQRSSMSDSHHYEEIVSSLKHLHLKRPVNQRTKLKEKKIFERRTKTVSADKYNLSVAAINTQRPVVWPGKLNCMSKKTDLDAIIQPSKLSVKGDLLCTSQFTTSIHTSNSEEKSRIAATLSKQNMSIFSNLKEQDGSPMSFSKLCTQNIIDSKGKSISPCEPSTSQTPSSSVSTSVKSLSTSSCPTTNHYQNFTFTGDHNQSSNQRLFSEYQSYEAFSQNSNPVRSNENKTTPSDSSLCIYSIGDYQDSATNFSLSNISRSSQANSVLAGLASERTCSEEVRMEESNVNELASYFEDLLHIPRKMSVMAEMMYA